VSTISGALAVARASPAGSSGLPGRPFAVAALIAWLLTAGIGAYMLRTWVARGGLRAQRATGVGVPPVVVFGHASAALTGLAVWLSYLGTGWAPLAWLGVVFVATAIMLGICTVTMWTPYPIAVPEAVPEVVPEARRAPGPVPGERRPSEAPGAVEVTDEMIARLLANPFPGRRRPKLRLVPLIPAAHGFAALATFMLATLAAINATLGSVLYQ
jgi:manganese efflux pump family protein